MTWIFLRTAIYASTQIKFTFQTSCSYIVLLNVFQFACWREKVRTLLMTCEFTIFSSQFQKTKTSWYAASMSLPSLFTQSNSQTKCIKNTKETEIKGKVKLITAGKRWQYNAGFKRKFEPDACTKDLFRNHAEFFIICQWLRISRAKIRALGKQSL